MHHFHCCRSPRCRSESTAFRTIATPMSLLLMPLVLLSATRQTNAMEPPQLEQVVQKWCEATKDVKSLKVGFRSWTYDDVFRVEKRGEGTFHFETPRSFRCERHPVIVNPGEQSSRRSQVSGSPFRLEADQRTSLILTDRQLYLRSNEEPWEVLEFDPEKGLSLFGMRFDPLQADLVGIFQPDQIQERFHIEFVSQTNDDIRLRLLPRTENDARQWSEITVILATTTCLPHAVQCVDAPRASTTVHLFTSLEINTPRRLGVDPFDLAANLEGPIRIHQTRRYHASQTFGLARSQRVDSSTKGMADSHNNAAILQTAFSTEGDDGSSDSSILVFDMLNFPLAIVQSVTFLAECFCSPADIPKGISDENSLRLTSVPELTERLDSPDSKVRQKSAQLLGEIGAAARPAVSKLGTLLNDADQQVSAAAFDALKRISYATPSAE